MTPPVACYSPSPGLTVRRTDKTTVIRGTMEMYGPQATPAIAKIVQTSINSTWTQSFPDGYSVNCNVTVVYCAPGKHSWISTKIVVKQIPGPSNVFSGPIERTMTLNSSAAKVYTWVAAHEFGHVLGLDDKYSEGILSKVSGAAGGKRNTTIKPGYHNHIMGQHGGTLRSRTLADLAIENSPYWWKQDDEIRDWVAGSTTSEIRKLDTVQKIAMLRKLSGTFVSAGDLAAIVKILKAVNTRSEADAIRAEIRWQEFNRLNQRYVMMSALGAMPE